MKQAIFLGDFEVVDIEPTRVQIHLGSGVAIWIYTHDFKHLTKLGDKLPLYTELTHALPSNTQN